MSVRTKVLYTTQPCTVCRESTAMALEPEKLAAWKAGAPIQNVWPEMPPEERELLISGTHSECWERLFEEERT